MSADPPRYETLDSTAFAGGRPASAYELKTLEWARLRLRRKEQALFTAAWRIDPSYAGLEGSHTYSPTLETFYYRVVPTFHVPKARVARLASVVVTYQCSGAWTLQVSSRAVLKQSYLQPGAAPGPNFVELGSILDTPDATPRLELALLAGVEEEISLWAQPHAVPNDLSILGITVTALRAGAL